MAAFETPLQRDHVNAFDWEPETPHNKRFVRSLSRRVLGNLENLSAPTLSDSSACSCCSAIKPLSPTQKDKFSAAMERMRDGSSLQRLKRERDIENVRQEEAMNRLQSLTTSAEPNDKGVSNPHVNLGRQAPERRMSGLARSA